jgi:hypothetical protein
MNFLKEVFTFNHPRIINLNMMDHSKRELVRKMNKCEIPKIIHFRGEICWSFEKMKSESTRKSENGREKRDKQDKNIG